jgi:hypothetical protein
MLRVLATTPGYRWLVVATACSAFLIYASGAWLPPYFIRTHGMTMAQLGPFSAAAVGGGGALGTLGTGIACDWLRRRTRHVESKMNVIVLALSIPTLLAAVFSVNLTLALVSMFLLNVCAYGWLGPTVKLVQNEVGADIRAAAIAVSTSIASILALGMGLPLVGIVSDRLGSAYGRSSLGVALALCMVPAALLGMFAHWRALSAHRAPS